MAAPVAATPLTRTLLGESDPPQATKSAAANAVMLAAIGKARHGPLNV
jgi:hypothetical protein